MAQTLTRLLVHVVFSTKERRDLIIPSVEPQLHAYMGGICRNRESPALVTGGTENHVHLLISLSKNIALSDLMMTLKKDSSKWIKTNGDAFRQPEIPAHPRPNKALDSYRAGAGSTDSPAAVRRVTDSRGSPYRLCTAYNPGDVPLIAVGRVQDLLQECSP